MDVDVLNSREIEIEVLFQHVQRGAMEAVQSNGELLQVLYVIRGTLTYIFFRNYPI